MRQLTFYDDNTRSNWEAATGGANVPALNDLLEPFSAAIGDALLSGTLTLGNSGSRMAVTQGAPIAKWPAGGHLHKAPVTVTNRGHMQGSLDGKENLFALLGVAQRGAGTIAVAADASCLDGPSPQCLWLLEELLDLAEPQRARDNWWLMHGDTLLTADFEHPSTTLPTRPPTPPRR